MIKTVGAAGGVAAAGSGVPATNRLNPVGEADAIGVIAAAAVGLAVGAAAGAAGMYVYDRHNGDEVDLDPKDNTRHRAWTAAQSVGSERSGPTGTRTQIRNDYIKPSSGDSAYGRASMNEIRTAAALAVFEGRSSEAEADAQQAHREQTTRSLSYIIEGWNQGVLTLAENGVMVEDWKEEAETITWGSSPLRAETEEFVNGDENVFSNMPEDWEAKGVEATKVDDGGTEKYLAFWMPLNPPIGADEIGDREQPLEVVVPFFGSQGMALPIDDDNRWFEPTLWNGTTGGNVIQAGHPDLELDDVTALNTGLFRDTLAVIDTEYNTVRGNLSEYVTTLVNGLEQGAIDPTQVLGPRDIAEEYADTDRRGLFAREMLATGAGIPENIGFRAKVSHPNLEADELWGDLYIRYDSDTDIEIGGPTTIESTEYRSALLGHYGQVTDDYQVVTLVGDSPLEILEVETEDQVRIDEPNVVVGENGEVVIGHPDELPEEYVSPEEKYQDWVVTISGADGTQDTVMQQNLIIRDEEVVAETSLEKGVGVSAIRITPPVAFRQTSQGIVDPANYDAELAQQNIDLADKINSEIEELIDDAVFGGGFFDGDLPSLPGLGVIESVVVVILAIVGLNAASG